MWFANQGERDRVDHLVGVVGEEEQVEHRLRTGLLQLLANVLQEHAHRLVRFRSSQPAHQLGVDRCGRDRDHRQGPNPGNTR
jgi:hypothetical protein